MRPAARFAVPVVRRDSKAVAIEIAGSATRPPLRSASSASSAVAVLASFSISYSASGRADLLDLVYGRDWSLMIKVGGTRGIAARCDVFRIRISV